MVRFVVTFPNQSGYDFREEYKKPTLFELSTEKNVQTVMKRFQCFEIPIEKKECEKSNKDWEKINEEWKKTFKEFEQRSTKKMCRPGPPPKKICAQSPYHPF